MLVYGTFLQTPSHVLSGHKGWVLCVEWEAMERKLAMGGHNGHVGPVFLSVFRRRFTWHVFRFNYGMASPLVMPSKATQNG